MVGTKAGIKSKHITENLINHINIVNKRIIIIILLLNCIPSFIKK